MKQYKYRAFVKLDSAGRASRDDPALPTTGGRVVVRARHHDSHRIKIFPALVSAARDEPPLAADHSVQLTMTVLGDDVRDYLETGDAFVLWRGHDIGHGVISRRLFLWTEAP